jgi:signal transduction histidine kinase/CheY-like chemotaxis protein
METLISSGNPGMEDIEQRITDDLLVSGYKLSRSTGRTITGSLVVFFVVAVMWSQGSHELLVIWGLLMVSALLLAGYNASAFMRQYDSGSFAQRWKIRILILSMIIGILWGSALLLFYNDGSVDQKIILLIVVISLSASGVLMGIYYPPNYFVYVIPIFAALIICLVQQGTFAYITLAVMMAWSLIFLLSFSKKLNQTMRSELRLRYEGLTFADELKRKTQEAYSANQAKSKFLAAASHDLRQPLHALSLFVDALKEAKSDEERAGIITHIDLSLEALRMLFDALLDLSRLDADVVKPEYSHFDVAEMLNDLAKEFRVDAYKKNIKLRVHARQTVVISDHLLLERILRNLISNAVRYTDKGGVLLSIRARGESVLLQVWDTGIGIPAESHEDVFVEFHQLHIIHRDRSQGLGLGLALVKRLCDLLGHPLKLNSRAGRGSVFSISLARGDINLLPTVNIEETTHDWELNGSRVLVIDDESEILHAMRVSLTKWGCQPMTAESLEDAIDQLTEKGSVPDLVLSDLRLRDNKTGIEAIDAIRERFGTAIPGILITGDTTSRQIKIEKQSGYEVLQKPVRALQLRSAIQHYLRTNKE